LLRLDQIGEDVGQFIGSAEASLSHDSLDDLAKRPKELIQQFQKAVTASLGVAKMAAAGFAGQSESEPPPEHDKFQRWMLEISPHELMTLLLRTFVIVACAELERFLREMARWHLTDKEIQRVRADRDRPPNLAHSNAKAKAQLIDLVCPTVGRPSVWPRRLRLVFGFRFPKPLVTSLRILVQWRHEFSHRNCAPLAVDWSGDPDAIESIITWWLACIASSDMVVARTRR
jgi:hypothetical protein